MLKLKNLTKNKILLEDLKVADNFLSRGIGLLFTKNLKHGQGLWITGGFVPQNSIHTFFMGYSIDCVFLDKNLIVQSILGDVRPWRFIPPQRKANSVIELPGHFIATVEIEIGDQLYVGN